MAKKRFNLFSVMKNFLRDKDTFGKPIRLNFNEKGDTFNTLAGGIVSMIVRIILILYLLVLIFFLYTDSNDLFVDFKAPYNVEGEADKINL